MPFTTAIIIGASRGLGLSLVHSLSSRSTSSSPITIYATIRGSLQPDKNGKPIFPEGVKVLEGIDVGTEEAGGKVVEGLKGEKVDLVVIVAGVLKKETLEEPSWEDEMDMYRICAVAPVFLTSALAKADCFAPNAKLILLTSEGGSITLRTQTEGGGMFGHHGSKAAANMIGRLLSFDLKERGITVGMIHPGFLITEMTEGMKEHYKKGGAITPEVAAPVFLGFVETLTLEQSGQFWAPNGPKGIGNAEEVLGKDLPTPLQVPW